MKEKLLNNLAVLLVTGFLLFSVSHVAIAKPGTNEDPLVSRSYTDSVVKFKPLSLPASTTIKLPAGCELVIVSPDTGLIECLQGDLNLFIDLTEGKRADTKGLMPYHHYLLASPVEATYKFKSSITGFVRGGNN